MPKAKKLYIKTYGCQMNVYDSERMAAQLGAMGYEEIDMPEGADMILLNTCHIREKAAEKVYSELGRYKPLKAQKPDLKIGVAGCVAQAEGQEIIARQPMVDLVVGSQSYHRLPAMLDRVATGQSAVDTDFPAEDKFDYLAHAPKAKRAPAAFLTVQEGCDKFCAFCVVPYTRGAEVSRPPKAILREARDLVDRGVRDITLLGQNVNAYLGDGTTSLAKLMDELAKIDDLVRIRFTTSHPNDMGDDLIAAFGDNPKVMPYLHLPVQSGSDKVLKAMNRKHTAAHYCALIERLRKVRPDLALSGDFIVGFPAETEADFQDTLELVRQVRYSQAYSFKYSERPGTPAADRKQQVTEADKSDRLQRLQNLLFAQQADYMASMMGKRLTVLLEREGRETGQLVGRSEYLTGVHLDGTGHTIGDLVSVRVVGVEKNSLRAEIVKQNA